MYESSHFLFDFMCFNRKLNRFDRCPKNANFREFKRFLQNGASSTNSLKFVQGEKNQYILNKHPFSSLSWGRDDVDFNLYYVHL